MNWIVQLFFFSSSGAGSVDIHSAPPSAFPSSISPHTHHLSSLSNHPNSLSPSPMSPQGHHTLSTLPNQNTQHHSTQNSHSILGNPNDNGIASPSSSSTTASTLLLLSNSSPLSIASTISPTVQSSQLKLITNPSGHSPMDTTSSIYQTPRSPLTQSTNISQLNLNNSNNHHLNGSSIHMSSSHLRSTNFDSLSNSHEPHYTSNPSTPTTDISSSCATPNSAVFAKTACSPAYHG